MRESITSSVPYGDIVRSPLFEEKRPSNGADGVFELPLRVPVEQRRLPHIHVPQENHLHVGLLHLGHFGHDAGSGPATGALFSPENKLFYRVKCVSGWWWIPLINAISLTKVMMWHRDCPAVYCSVCCLISELQKVTEVKQEVGEELKSCSGAFSPWALPVRFSYRQAVPPSQLSAVFLYFIIITKNYSDNNKGGNDCIMKSNIGYEHIIKSNVKNKIKIRYCCIHVVLGWSGKTHTRKIHVNARSFRKLGKSVKMF